MVQEKLQMKFERNPCIRFRDNCDTDDGRTDDGRRTKVPYHELCWQSQAELKMDYCVILNTQNIIKQQEMWIDRLLYGRIVTKYIR